MNIIKFNYKLWRDAHLRRQENKTSKHLTKVFYLTLDEAIERCKREPRKYYILQESASSYQIIGSQEVRRLKKFSEVRKDETFIDLQEKSFFVSPENIKRLEHEQNRRKYRWWFLFAEYYYVPVTKGELQTLKEVEYLLMFSKEYNSKKLADAISEIIKKHS